MLKLKKNLAGWLTALTAAAGFAAKQSAPVQAAAK
jgi:hypothetical protein